MRSTYSLRSAVFAAAVVCSAAALPAHAGPLFDFEDGTLQGWLSANTVSAGSTLVELHNGSQMASAQHGSRGTTSLSHDFAFSGGSMLSFEMQAIAIRAVGGGSSADAYSGVTASFLNAFNVSLGSFSLFNTTKPATLLANQFAIDNLSAQLFGNDEQLRGSGGYQLPEQYRCDFLVLHCRS